MKLIIKQIKKIFYTAKKLSNEINKLNAIAHDAGFPSHFVNRYLGINGKLQKHLKVFVDTLHEFTNSTI